MIERTQTYSPQPCSIEFADAFGDYNRVNLEMHSMAPKSRECGDALGRHARGRLEYMETVDGRSAGC